MSGVAPLSKTAQFMLLLLFFFLSWLWKDPPHRRHSTIHAVNEPADICTAHHSKNWISIKQITSFYFYFIFFQILVISSFSFLEVVSGYCFLPLMNWLEVNGITFYLTFLPITCIFHACMTYLRSQIKTWLGYKFQMMQKNLQIHTIIAP